MNERIKELVIASHNSAADEISHLERIHNRSLSLNERAEVFEGKFAALIIADAVAVCTGVSDVYVKYRLEESDFAEKNRFAEGQSACNIVQHKIRKHFGVK